MPGRIPRGPMVVTIAVATVVLAGVMLGGPGAHARPYVPASDDVVVERLARASRDPRAQELSALRRALAEAPDDPQLAAQLARQEIDEARRRSDPRHLGYAQAALQRWWLTPTPPIEVLILRATIRQSRHEFESARSDLDQAVERAPDDPQAWLTRSVVLAVLGRYAEARASCLPLPRLTTPLIAQVCSAAIDGITGKAVPATAALTAAIAANPDDGGRAWALSVLGDLDVVRGDLAAAEGHLRGSLDLEVEDAYTRAALADLLLEERRYREVKELCAGREQNDGLLLRLALAESGAKASGAAEHAQELAARFEASRLRGDALHKREEARFELVLRHDPERALELASANWRVQHEAADARILLEAAVAAGRGGAAEPAVRWLAETQHEDRRLTALLLMARERQ